MLAHRWRLAAVDERAEWRPGSRRLVVRAGEGLLATGAFALARDSRIQVESIRILFSLQGKRGGLELVGCLAGIGRGGGGGGRGLPRWN